MKPTEFGNVTLSRYASDIKGEMSFEQLLIHLNGKDRGGRPKSTSPVLMCLGGGLSHKMPDDVRQQLLEHVVVMLQSHDMGAEEARRDHIAFAAVIRIAPLYLRCDWLTQAGAIALEEFDGPLQEAAQLARKWSRCERGWDHTNAAYMAAYAAEQVSPTRAAEETVRAIALTAQIDPAAWKIAIDIFQEAIELGAHYNGNLTDYHRQRLGLLQAA